MQLSFKTLQKVSKEKKKDDEIKKMTEPFRKMHLDEEEKGEDTFTMRLNPEERKQLEEDKEILKQKKDGTAIKQLASLGSKVLHDPKIAEIVAIVQGNKRRNKRLGIADFD